MAAALLTTILFAFVGVGFHQILIDPRFRAPIAVAVIALFAAALSLGRIAGNLISAISGALVNFFSEIHEPRAFTDYVIRPVVGIIIIGAFPAFVFGLIYSAMVRKALSEA